MGLLILLPNTTTQGTLPTDRRILNPKIPTQIGSIESKPAESTPIKRNVQPIQKPGQSSRKEKEG